MARPKKYNKGTRIPRELKAAVRERKREARGNRAHVPTKKLRDKVILLRAHGWPAIRIARLIGISEPTMWKHYKVEIEEGRDIKEAELRAIVDKKAKDGNMPAVRMAMEEVRNSGMISRDRPRPDELLPQHGATTPPKPKKEPKLGKKEQAELDAQKPDVATPFGALLTERQTRTQH